MNAPGTEAVHPAPASGAAATQTADGHELRRSVTFFGMVALGLGGVWGTSWLVVAGTWLKAGGGVVNALLAWVLIAVVEFPFVVAYLRAVPMFPKADGEMSYANAAFGPTAGFWAAWFGILVNLIVCAYEVVSLFAMLDFLWPGFDRITWYQLSGSKVGPITIVIGLVIVLGIGYVHLRRVRVSSRFTKVLTTTLIVLVSVGVVLALVYGDFGNFRPWFGKPAWAGVLAVAPMLPFSFAGWESIAKGAEEAADSSSSGRAVPIAWGTAWVAYILVVLATGLVMPWQQGATEAMPFAAGLTRLTGTRLAGDILVGTATIGVIGVYNALFYSMTRQMFGMARRGQLPAWFAQVDGRGVPRRTVLFATGLLVLAPLLGKGLLISYVNAASFAYITLWGATFLSVLALRRRRHETASAATRLLELLGCCSLVFMLAIMLYPKSPGALRWPTEHAILAVLIVLGALLHLVRRGRRETGRAANSDEDAASAGQPRKRR